MHICMHAYIYIYMYVCMYVCMSQFSGENMNHLVLYYGFTHESWSEVFMFFWISG